MLPFEANAQRFAVGVFNANRSCQLQLLTGQLPAVSARHPRNTPRLPALPSKTELIVLKFCCRCLLLKMRAGQIFADKEFRESAACIFHTQGSSLNLSVHDLRKDYLTAFGEGGCKSLSVISLYCQCFPLSRKKSCELIKVHSFFDFLAFRSFWFERLLVPPLQQLDQRRGRG